MEVCCAFSLESPHGGDSNRNIQYTIFNIKRKPTLNYPKFVAIGFFQGHKNEFKTVVVDEPSMFEPLKFYCMSSGIRHKQWCEYYKKSCSNQP